MSYDMCYKTYSQEKIKEVFKKYSGIFAISIKCVYDRNYMIKVKLIVKDCIIFNNNT